MPRNGGTHHVKILNIDAKLPSWYTNSISWSYGTTYQFQVSKYILYIYIFMECITPFIIFI
jgi:hypothetical protein